MKGSDGRTDGEQHSLVRQKHTLTEPQKCSTMDNTHTHTHTLPAEAELRIECSTKKKGDNTNTTVTLLQGSCELFGAELAQNTPYPMEPGSKLALFTWHGCTLKVEDHAGLLLHQYVSTETNANVAHVNTHAQLEALRDKAVASLTSSSSSFNNNNNNNTIEESHSGPRVLLTGPGDCGKSSLQRILTAYAVKLGRSPIVVDLDPTHNSLSIPGTIAAAVVSSHESVSVSSHLNHEGSIIPATSSPLVFWNGSLDSSALFKMQITKLGESVTARMKHDVEARTAGCIINTPGIWADGEGYELLKHAIVALRVNVVLVLGHDRLYSMLSAHLLNTATATANVNSCKIIKLPRSGGVVSRDIALRRMHNQRSVKSYFHGETIVSAGGGDAGGGAAITTLMNQYTPYVVEVRFSDLRIFKLSTVSLATSMLPISQMQATDPVQLNAVEIGPVLKHAILAVSHPMAVEAYDKSHDNKELYLSNAAGFVVVEDVDMERNMIKLLSPCAGGLPSSTLLAGDVTWME